MADSRPDRDANTKEPMKRKLTILAAVVAVALIVLAWHAPTVTGHTTCASGIQTGHVSAHNDESQTATVRSSSGPVFLVGDTIPAHTTKTETFTRPGTFTGNVTVSFAVDFPSDQTDRSASVTLHFGGCVPPTTTTTTAAPTTTTTGQHATTTEPVGLIPPAVVTAPPATPTVTPPEFTG